MNASSHILKAFVSISGMFSGERGRILLSNILLYRTTLRLVFMWSDGVVVAVMSSRFGALHRVKVAFVSADKSLVCEFPCGKLMNEMGRPTMFFFAV